MGTSLRRTGLLLSYQTIQAWHHVHSRQDGFELRLIIQDSQQDASLSEYRAPHAMELDDPSTVVGLTRTTARTHGSDPCQSPCPGSAAPFSSRLATEPCWARGCTTEAQERGRLSFMVSAFAGNFCGFNVLILASCISANCLQIKRQKNNKLENITFESPLCVKRAFACPRCLTSFSCAVNLLRSGGIRTRQGCKLPHQTRRESQILRS